MNKERGLPQNSSEFSSSQQFYFIQQEGGFEIPQILGKDYPDLARYLATQSLWRNCLWKNRENTTPALLLDFQKDTAFTFNPQNWQKETQFSLHDPLPESTSGALLICSSWGKQEKETLETVSLFLTENTPVFIFENFPHKKSLNREELAKEVQKRKRILQDLGLAEAKILTRPSPKKTDKINDFLVWRARMPKEWQPRKPVNLLEEGPYWRKNWIQGLLERNRNQYEKDGYWVTNDEMIKNALRKTTFPLNTLGQTKLGFGYELEEPCGCRWQVGLNGAWTCTYQCEVDCEG